MLANMNKFTVILPIHNEQMYLSYSLPSIYQLFPDEIILLFDNCTDKSKEIAYKITERHRLINKTKFVDVPESPDWRFRTSFLRFYGTKLAKNNLVLVSNADIILDSRTIQYVHLIGKNNDIGLISFMYKDFPINWRNMLQRLLVTTKNKVLGSERWITGIHVFNKKIALESENIESLKKVESAEDTHLHQAITKGHQSLCVKSDSIHLRPRQTTRDLLKGRLYWTVVHRSFFHTCLVGIFYFRLKIIKGYVQARWGNGK